MYFFKQKAMLSDFLPSYSDAVFLKGLVDPNMKALSSHFLLCNTKADFQVSGQFCWGTNFPQNIFFVVQRKESNTGLQ